MDKFRQALSHAGLETDADIIADGMLHRFHVIGDKPHKKNGWYILHDSDPVAGAFGCWKRGISETWCEKEPQSFTTEERNRHKANMEIARKQREIEQARVYEECRIKSQALWDKGTKADLNHPYISTKQIKTIGLRQLDDELLVPVQDLNDLLHGLQFINSTGDKKFKTGTVKAGNFCRIPGDKTGPILICEGYATGASLYEATGHTVIVAFDAGNLAPVANILKEKVKDRALIVCADNDQWTVGNPGLTKATIAARETGALLATPEFQDTTTKPTDFNDLHQLEGIESVRLYVENAKVIPSEMEKTFASATWPSIIHLDDLASLPKFPVDALPEVGREMVKAVAEVHQVDAGFPAGVYLAALATTMQRKAGVSLITHREPLSLYVCPILESGERKSSTISVMTRPLYDYQLDKAESMKAEIYKASANDKVNRARLAAKEKEAAKATTLEAQQKLSMEIAVIEKEIADNPVPHNPLFIVDDITPEKLGEAMTAHGERMSIISAEGGIFGTMAGRYSKGGANFDILLQAHAGDAWSAHRMGREACCMQSPALTMCLSVQPDVIREIGSNRQFKGRGLLARFLFSMNGSQAGHRKRHTNPIPPEIMERYRAHLWALMDIPVMEHDLSLTSSAQAAWDEFYNDVEITLGTGEDMEGIKDWGSKLPGAAARIAALLHFAIHGQSGATMQIEPETIHSATAISSYYAEQALAVFGFMREDPHMESARLILEYIDRHKPEHFTGRDVMRKKHALNNMDKVTPGLKVLEERGYIMLAEDGYTVNPHFYNDRKSLTTLTDKPEADVLSTLSMKSMVSEI